MGYTHVDGTLLDKAKDRAKQYIEELPEGSLVTVIPLCGTESPVANDAYAFKDKALLEAIDSIEAVDRTATVKAAAIKFASAEAKVRDLAAFGGAGCDIERIIGVVWNIDALPDVQDLTRLLAAPC